MIVLSKIPDRFANKTILVQSIADILLNLRVVIECKNYPSFGTAERYRSLNLTDTKKQLFPV